MLHDGGSADKLCHKRCLRIFINLCRRSHLLDSSFCCVIVFCFDVLLDVFIYQFCMRFHDGLCNRLHGRWYFPYFSTVCFVFLCMFLFVILQLSLFSCKRLQSLNKKELPLTVLNHTERVLCVFVTSASLHTSCGIQAHLPAWNRSTRHPTVDFLLLKP